MGSRAANLDQFRKLDAGGEPRPPMTDSERLTFQNRLAHAIGENRDDPDRMMQLASAIAAEAFGGMCAITLLNRQSETLHVAAYHDANARAQALISDLVQATGDLPQDTGLIGRVIQSGLPLRLQSVDEEQLKRTAPPALSRFVDEIGVSSILLAPLRGTHATAGAMGLARHRGDRAFDEGDEAFLVEAAYQVGVALESHPRIASLRADIAAFLSSQQALMVSEEWFRSVFETTTLGIEMMDPAGTILDANSAFEAMTGYSRSELVRTRYEAIQHPEDVSPVRQILTALQTNREAGEPVENRLIHRRGATVWVKTNFAGIRKSPDDETVSLVVAVHEDITGRKQTEQYFQGVLEAIPDALVLVDAKGKLVLVNRQMERMFGYERHEILGQNVEQLIPERLRGGHPRHRAEYMLNPYIRPMGANLDLFAVRKDGTEFPVEISLSPLRVDEAPVVLAAIRDISARKRREAALLRSQHSLAEAQAVAHLGSLDYDIASGKLEASDEALRIFGIPREEFQGSETVRARMHPDDEARVVERTNAAVQNRGAAELEFRVVHPDGSVRIVHDRVIGVYDESGKPVRMVGTVQDVTEQRQAEQEMTEMKSHLQGSMELERLRLAQELHDGPMQDLYGATYRLNQLREGLDQKSQADLEDVNEQLQHTIRELRGMAKELRPPSISHFGLEKAIRSYAEDFRQKYPNIDLQLSLAQDRQLLPENMRLTLFRVFQQALANVLRHSQASEVRVRFSLDAEEARLEVSDNGMGFTVPGNWMGFVRKGHYGLAGAAERVNALGGTLRVESEPHRSTTITAVIPWTPGGEQ